MAGRGERRGRIHSCGARGMAERGGPDGGADNGFTLKGRPAAAERTSPRAGSGGGGGPAEPRLRPEGPEGRPGREGEGGRPQPRNAGGGLEATGWAGAGSGSRPVEELGGVGRLYLDMVQVKVM